ncbi:MAG: Bax inhibitor-1/YccA family protein [Clostridia bacterium]|nr:Bax inhibitor-1/YccA family protein [Clostridia bacterium]
MNRSSNPAIKKLGKNADAFGFGAVERASYAGIGLKVGIYVALTLLSAVLFVALLPTLFANNPGVAAAMLIMFIITAAISNIVAAFRPRAAGLAGGIYCVAEGALVGLVSALFEAVVQGVIIMALLATILTLAVVALLYFTGIVRVGARFRRFVLVALIGTLLTQLTFFLLSLFVPSVALVFYDNFGLQLVVCIIYIVLASLCLFTDFDNMTNIVENGLTKNYEWYAAYSLMVSLIWLYMEFLRLALIIASNRD